MTITQLINKYGGEIINSTATFKEIKLAGNTYTLTKNENKQWTLTALFNFELVEFYETLSEAYERIAKLVDVQNRMNDEQKHKHTFKAGDIVKVNDITLHVVSSMGAYYIVFDNYSRLQQAINKNVLDKKGVLING